MERNELREKHDDLFAQNTRLDGKLRQAVEQYRQQSEKFSCK